MVENVIKSNVTTSKVAQIPLWIENGYFNYGFNKNFKILEIYRFL